MSVQTSLAEPVIGIQDASQALEEAFVPERHAREILPATILSIGEKEVLLDIGSKGDGVVSRNEFRDLPTAKPGDAVEELVEALEDKAGNIRVSRKKARILKVWKRIYEAKEKQEVIEVLVKERTSGGLLVDIDGVKGFLPGSQIDLMPISDFDAFVGQRLQVQVLPSREGARVGRDKMETVIVSRRALLESAQRELVEKLEVGDVLEGTVKNITKFGAFVELASGIIGLVHIREAVWDKRVNDPSEARDAEGKPLFKVGGKVTVLIKGFEEQEGDTIPRISLSTKGTPEHKLLPNPWEALAPEVQEGAIVTGKVREVKEKGVTVEVAPGVEGFVPLSELSASTYVATPKDVTKPGDEVTLRVLEIDREAQELRLSIRQTGENPWEAADFHQKYGLDSRHQAIVRKYAERQKGAYLEVAPGVEAYLDNEHISWTERVGRASDKLAIGETCEVIVLGVKESEQQLLVGIRELKESPWSTFAEIFPVGSVHKGTIKRQQKHGALVELPYGLEVFVPAKELVKQDGDKPATGEALDLMVQEFNKEDHHLFVSHLATYQQQSQATTGSKKASAGQVYTVEKSTLSDVGALAKIKEEMGKPSKKKTGKGE